MNKLLCTFILIAALTTTIGSYGEILEGNAKYVDPFIGVEGGGNVFPGVCVPFGIVKLGPDCGNKDWNAGWDPTGDIHGFSHTHVSGTGGGCKYGNILFMPIVGPLDVNNYSSPRVNEHTELGLYETELKRYHTSVQLTALSKTALHQYTFPKSRNAKILIDLGSFLASHERQEFVGSEIRILNDTTVEGYQRIRGGWNEGDEYTVYFYAVFDTPAQSTGTWKNGKISTQLKEQYDTNERTGAYFQYATESDQVIRVKVGISYLSVGKAKANLSQISTWHFDTIRSAAIAQWNQILNKISIEGKEQDKKIFYTALYHCYLQPVDKSDENSKWKTNEPYYDDFYAIWDTFRATHPLFTLLTPSKQSDMIRSLIDIYKHDGYMPDARSGDDNGRVQGGSNCDILIADAIVKGLKNIDYQEALDAMLKNAEVPPGDNERKEGRGGIFDYNTLGYVSTTYERSLSRTFEYANCDFAIATVASILNQPQIAEKYYKRASNWENIWNEQVTAFGHAGYAWPRASNGEFWAQDKFNVLAGGTWPHVIYETFPYELSFYVPHDMRRLIEKCGGKATFIDRLNVFFTHKEPNWDQKSFVGLFQISNEPGFLIPTLYNYVNQQSRTAYIVRKILAERYNVSREGIPGNDDSGSMSAWYIFHALGFYPNAGQDIYLISSPIFKNVSVQLENGAMLTIKVKGGSDKNIYIKSLKINGKQWTKNWFRHSDIASGAVLEFEMIDEPSAWDVDGEIAPSLSDK